MNTARRLMLNIAKYINYSVIAENTGITRAKVKEIILSEFREVTASQESSFIKFFHKVVNGGQE